MAWPLRSTISCLAARRLSASPFCRSAATSERASSNQPPATATRAAMTANERAVGSAASRTPRTRPDQPKPNHIILLLCATRPPRCWFDSTGGTLATPRQTQALGQDLFAAHLGFRPLFLQNRQLGLPVQHDDADPAIHRIQRIVLVEQDSRRQADHAQYLAVIHSALYQFATRGIGP